jgi:hypothetical protein
MIVLGVDPGGRTTGLCLCDGRTVIDWSLIERHPKDAFETYIQAVDYGVTWHIHSAHKYDDNFDWAPPVAVEDLVDPNPHLGITAVRGLLYTAQVIGAIRATFDVTMIRPGGHGSNLLKSYPPELVGPKEGAAGKGKMRHVRSAFDVAQAYAMTARLEARRHNG